MLGETIFRQLEDIAAIATAHKAGKKFVFLGHDDTANPLTQFAYGVFAAGESSDYHTHATMEEYFFVIKGEGSCTISGHRYPLKAGCFLRIPAGALHSLDADGTSALEFIYFGIAE